MTTEIIKVYEDTIMNHIYIILADGTIHLFKKDGLIKTGTQLYKED
jgi:hypothetical protein